MVDIAVRPWDTDTDVGSCRNAATVCRAARFCWKDVPWLGGCVWPDGCGEEAVVANREKRDWRSLACVLLAPGVVAGNAERRGGGGGLLPAAGVGCGGDGVLPIPKAGTEMPAAPSRLIAPWFSMPD